MNDILNYEICKYANKHNFKLVLILRSLNKNFNHKYDMYVIELNYIHCYHTMLYPLNAYEECLCFIYNRNNVFMLLVPDNKRITFPIMHNQLSFDKFIKKYIINNNLNI